MYNYLIFLLCICLLKRNKKKTCMFILFSFYRVNLLRPNQSKQLSDGYSTSLGCRLHLITIFPYRDYVCNLLNFLEWFSYTLYGWNRFNQIIRGLFVIRKKVCILCRNSTTHVHGLGEVLQFITILVNTTHSPWTRKVQFLIILDILCILPLTYLGSHLYLSISF